MQFLRLAIGTALLALGFYGAHSGYDAYVDISREKYLLLTVPTPPPFELKLFRAMLGDGVDLYDAETFVASLQDVMPISVRDKQATAVGRKTRRPTTDDAINSYLAENASGIQLGLQMPTQLDPGEPYLATFIAYPNENDLTPYLHALAENPVPTVVDQSVNGTLEIQAEMSSAGVDFFPQLSGWQKISKAAPAIWTWKITSANPGLTAITISVRQRVVIKGEIHEVALQTFTKTVVVGPTTWGQTLRDGKDWMWENAQTVEAVLAITASLFAIILGVKAFLTALAKKRRRIMIAKRKRAILVEQKINLEVDLGVNSAGHPISEPAAPRHENHAQGTHGSAGATKGE
jgi:hypothetical protein